MNGDVHINQKHHNYVDALKGKKGWGEGDYVSNNKTSIEHYLDAI